MSEESLRSFQEEENRKIREIAEREDVDLGVAASMFRHEQRSQFPDLASTQVMDYGSLRGELLRGGRTTRQPVTPPDFLGQARSEVAPAFDRSIGQLTQQVEGTRRTLPQQLAARGQALGGLRGQQEDALTRDLAYGTADLRAQQEMAAIQRADVLGQRWTEQQRFDIEQDFRERSLQEQIRMNDFSMESTLRQIKNQEDAQRYKEQRDLIEDEWRQIEFDERVRASSVSEAISWYNAETSRGQLETQRGYLALAQQQYADEKAARDAALAQASAQTGVDLSLPEYKRVMDNAQKLWDKGEADNLINYLDSLRGQLPPEVVSTMEMVFGVQEFEITRDEFGFFPTGTDTISYIPRTGNVTVAVTPEGKLTNPPSDTLRDLEQVTSYIMSQDIFQTGTVNTVDPIKMGQLVDSLYQNRFIDANTFMQLYDQYNLPINK